MTAATSKLRKEISPQFMTITTESSNDDALKKTTGSKSRNFRKQTAMSLGHLSGATSVREHSKKQNTIAATLVDKLKNGGGDFKSKDIKRVI